MSKRKLYVQPGWIVLRDGDVRPSVGLQSEDRAVAAAEAMLEDGGEILVLNG